MFTGIWRRFSEPRERSSRRGLRRLALSSALPETMAPQIVRATMYIICSAVMVFLTWASFTEVNEVARADGEVVPDGYVRVVQHLEGGIIAALDVREGDLVEKGQVLARIDGTGSMEDLLELRAKQSALEIKAERLKAFVENRPPAFGVRPGSDPSTVEFQKSIYQGMVAARDGEERVIHGQIEQKKQELVILDRKKQTIDRRLASVRQAYKVRKQLLDKGLTSRLVYLEQKAELDQLEGERLEITTQMDHARMMIAEFENRLSSLIARHRDEAFEELEDTENAIAQNREAISKRQDRVSRLQVRAPVKGLVKGIRVKTIGAVISAGQTLMEIVPIDERLVAEVRIAPSDVGHIRIGQPVRVKVTSYDFARYGAIDGVLDFISATTFSGPTGQRYYLGRISLARDHLGEDRGRNRVSPGMIVQADIVTGAKSIIAYLLKPIRVSLNAAFTER